MFRWGIPGFRMCSPAYFPETSLSLAQSQPEKGPCFDSHSLVYSPWSTSKTAKCQVLRFLPQMEPHPSPCGPLELYPAGSGMLQ